MTISVDTLVNALPGFLRPPSRDYAGDLVRARLTYWVMVVFGVCCLFGTAVSPFVAALPWLAVGMYIALLLLCVGLLRVVHAGRAEMAGAVMSSSCFVLTTAGVLLNRGMHSPAVVAYPVAIVMAGLLWNGRAAAFLTLASLAITGALALDEPAHPGIPTPADMWASFVVSMVTMLTLTQMALIVIRNGLARSQQAEQRLGAVLEQSADGVLLLSEEGEIRRANRVARKLLDASDPQGPLTASDLPGPLSDAVLDFIQASHHGEVARGPNTLQLGPDLPVDLLMSVFRHEERGIYVSLRDVSARLAAEQALAQMREELLQSQKMEFVGQLASGIAHDFNNYLTVVLGSSMLALERPGLPKETRAELQEIHDAAQRAAQVARGLLDFSRQRPPADAVQDVDGTLSALSPLLQRLVGDGNPVELDLGGPPGISIDKSQLEVAIVNLLANARDASPPGAVIRITTAVAELTTPDRMARPALGPGTYVQIAVDDQGAGVPPDRIDQLFEPFYTTKAPGAGTGLGLSTVLHITRDAGGGVRVKTDPETGTRFELLFPVSREHPRAPLGEDRTAVSERTPAQPVDDSVVRSRPAIVLAVDDEPGVLRLVEQFLRKAGHQVVAAAGGPVALDALEAGTPFDLLLTDITMPGVSGLEVATRFRALHPDVPVVFVSGNVANARQQLGPDEAFVAKPFDEAVLVAAVARALRSSKRAARV